MQERGRPPPGVGLNLLVEDHVGWLDEHGRYGGKEVVQRPVEPRVAAQFGHLRPGDGDAQVVAVEEILKGPPPRLILGEDAEDVHVEIGEA